MTLPLETTSFIGREQLLATLCGLLRREGTRLLTLTGPGGTGKTRLALQAARRLAGAFPGGACFVGLAPITDPDLVLPAVGRAMGLNEAVGQTALDALQRHIGNQELLLVLDNLEQVLGAAPQIAELLAACPNLHVLATSRAILHLAGEQELPVPPLSLPATTSADDLAGNEAVALFVERAQAARPDFAVTAENAQVVVNVCRMLDGLPLAIELAAARLRALTLTTLAQRLERRLPLLTGGPRDAPARQQTLRDAIAWSYGLLPDAEQRLFRRLAAFRGCTLEAAEEVCCADAEGPGTSSIKLDSLGVSALDGLTALVENSLLRRDEAEDGQPWYVMLETVREFALEQLTPSGEEAAVRRRHALYYLHLAERTDRELHGPRQVALLDRLAREHDNFREALGWCAAQGYAAPALRTATALWWFWYVRGYGREGLECLRDLLRRFKPRGATDPRIDLRVRALEAAGQLAAFQGDLESARELHQRNLPVVQELGDQNGLYRTLQNLGFVARQQGDWPAARKYFENCLAVARSSEGPGEVGYALFHLGNLAHDEGEHERARQLLLESLPFLEQTGEPRTLGNGHLSLGIVAHDQGDYEEARQQTERAVALWQESGDRRGLASSPWTNLASIAIAQGDLAKATQLLVDSLRTLQEFGDVIAIAGVLERFGFLMLAHGDSRQALRFAGAAAAIREAKGERLPPTAQQKLEARFASAWDDLGSSQAALAFAGGRSLSYEEAVAEALAVSQGQPTEAARPLVAKPGNQLTAREQQIVTLLAQGATNRQIANTLVISEGTAANHVLHILNKLGYDSRTQVAVWAVQHGWVAEPQPA